MTSDPHGLILSLISICTVFLCLLILYGLYSLVGLYFIRKASSNKPATADTEDKPQDEDQQIAAAIAVALELHLKEGKRRITIDPQESDWGSPERNFRRYERL